MAPQSTAALFWNQLYIFPKIVQSLSQKMTTEKFEKFRVDGQVMMHYFVLGFRDELTETMPGKREKLGKRFMRI